MSIMKVQAENMEGWRLACGICFDEMSINSVHVYDKVQDCISSNSKVQVVMARGLFDPWKQPIFFDFDTPMTASLLMTIINRLEESGYPVYSVTSDLGAENRALFKCLEIDLGNCKFKNPSADRYIYVFPDVPHDLKNIRNHVLDDGVQLATGHVIQKSTFEILLEANSRELKLCPKFNSFHLDVTGAERMRVRPAAQLLSNHVAKLAKFVLPNNTKFAEFVQTVNDGFDVLNSRVKNDFVSPLKSGLGSHFQEQECALKKLRDLMSTSRFLIRNKSELAKPRNSLLPCQIGFCVAINATLELYSVLKNDFPNVKYLLTSRLNQDCLENLFSQIRGFGGPNTCPTTVEFKYRLRLLLLGSKLKSPTGANTDANTDKCSIMSAELLDLNKLKTLESKQSNRGLPLPRKSNQTSKADDQTDKQSLVYLAVYIAWRLKRNAKANYGFQSRARRSNSWISLLSKGGLITPTQKLYDWILNCNSLFEAFMKENGSAVGITHHLQDLIVSKHRNIDIDVVKEFLKIRIKIRTKFLNIKSIRARSKVNQRKSRQFAGSCDRKKGYISNG